ncbi:MAG: hypothetical protein GYB66_07705 [Chloroflexi bacterium]|nr:hypothetical protein [Chloroflexota bacterium]
MQDEELKRAQQLVSEGQYEKARQILQRLAFQGQPEAQQLLQQLNSFVPPRSTAQTGGCAFLTTRGLMLVGSLLTVCILCSCVVLIAIGLLADSAQREAEEANDGRGAKDNPIPANEVVKFKNFNIEVGDIIRPADARVLEMSPAINEEAAEGMEYVLVWLRMECARDEDEVCEGRDVRTRLVDNQGTEWGRDGSDFTVIEPDFAQREAAGGNSLEGWKYFVIRQDRQMDLFKFSEGGVDLYIEIPR